MNRIGLGIGLAAGMAALTSTASAAAVSKAFTYQGRLVQDGQPANGIYDLSFFLKDAPSGGNNVGFAEFFEDVPVVDCLFTVELDFGLATLNGQGRWLEISVRPGSQIVTPTTLSPRQQLCPAPYAVHALGSDQWKSVGDDVMNANGGFVGVNRSTALNGTELFGIQAPIQAGYGGMYVATDGAGAKPYYGYAAGPDLSCWTYLNGPTGTWSVNMDGLDQLNVTEEGHVGVGTTNPTGKLHAVNTATNTNAARFENTNAASTASALVSNCNGSGIAMWGKNTGTGSGARVEIANSTNSSPALDVRTNGTGLAAKFTGGDVDVGGELYARIGTVKNRATPVAFGRFDPFGAGTLHSSSGNVTITDEGSNGYRVFVVGEGDPDMWTIITSVDYSSLSDPTVRGVQTSTPLSVIGQPGNGVFYIKTHCLSDCEEFEASYRVNFVVYKGL